MFLHTREEILSLLRCTVDGSITLDKFQSRFEHLLLDREGWPILDPDDKEFFDLVLEKVSWTSDNPTDTEKELGWMDFSLFRTWLKDSLKLHLSNE